MPHPYLNGGINKNFKDIFYLKKGNFGQEYYSASFTDREVTIDDLSGMVIVCVSTPIVNNESGEVVRSWKFDSEQEAIEFVIKAGLLV